MGINNQDPTSPIPAIPRNPASTPTSIVSKIVFLTIGVYLLQLATRVGTESRVFHWLAIERDLVLQAGQVWRLVTYAFCHSETHYLHIMCNMAALYFLGRAVAHTLGDREFAWMYLAAAVFAGIVQVCSMALVPNLGGQDWALGASGAVSAVFVLFAMHYPRLKLYFFGVIPVQARVLLALVIVYDGLGFFGMVPGLFAGNGAKIGHAAHIGGLVFGFLYFRWEMRITRWWDLFAGRVKQVELPRKELRVYNPGVQPEVDFSLKIDDILAKISRGGEESLTDRERRVLKQASEHLKSSR